jgi:hypothetical protein
VLITILQAKKNFILADGTNCFEGKGICYLKELNLIKKYSYSNNFELDGNISGTQRHLSASTIPWSVSRLRRLWKYYRN